MSNINPLGTVTIECGPNSLVLPVNPDQQLSHDIRVTVVQTLGGYYFDDFGMGIPQLQLSGTSAFQSGQARFNGQPVDGNTAIQHLYTDIIQYYFKSSSNGSNSATMKIYDDAFGRWWQVKPIGQLQLSRVNSDPLVINYSQTFVVIQDGNLSSTQQKVPDNVIITWSSASSVSSQASTSVHAAASTASSVKQTPNFVYTVQSGDTLWTIAKQYLPQQATSEQVQQLVNQIVQVNNLRSPSLIFPGERLTIPA